MTWISLICLLALSSTAFGLPAYGGGYGSAPALPQAPRMLTMMREQIIPRPLPVPTQSYGQQQPLTTEWSTPLVQQQQQDTSFQQKLQGGYGSQLIAPTFIQKTLPVQSYGQINQGYGAMPMISQFDQQIQVQPVQILTQADILCRGQQPETVIPLENGWKFVVCLADGKGVEQQCPKGLYYHAASQRCERKLGPLENVCASQPCLNGGQCIPADSTYQCQCAPGFDGKTCELDARICQTQQPCGQAPDTKCQSFRLGAALQYICIFQDGLAYGLSASQAISSPCQGVDGPQALSVSNQGFIMCDGERMFVESCPGGTLWDDINKACAWPDMQASSSQFDQQQGYGQSSYGQQRTIVSQPTYDNQWTVQQPKQLPSFGYGAQTLLPKIVKTLQSYGNQLNNQQLDQSQFGQSSSSYGNQFTVPQQPKVIQSSYGAQTVVPQQFEQSSSYGNQFIVPQQPKVIKSSYGAQTLVPKIVKTLQSYGSQLNNQQLDQSSSSYGNQFTVPQQPRVIQSSYGAQTFIPQQFEQSSSYGAQTIVPQQPKVIKSSYGAQTVVPQQFEQSSSYGAQTIVPQVKTIHSYGSQLNNQQLDQSSSSYGNQFTVPQQPRVIQSSYGAQTFIPQQFEQSSSYGAQTIVPQVKTIPSYGGQFEQAKFVQPSSYGSQLIVQQPQVKFVQPSYGAPRLVPQQAQLLKSVQSYGGQQKDELVSEGQSSGY